MRLLLRLCPLLLPRLWRRLWLLRVRLRLRLLLGLGIPWCRGAPFPRPSLFVECCCRRIGELSRCLPERPAEEGGAAAERLSEDLPPEEA